jgi:chemotaxis protein CheX
MDVRFINAFIAAIMAVFKTMLATDVTINRPTLKQPEDRNADVSALIGLSGDAVGAVVLSFPMVTAAQVASKFSGVEMNAEHADFADALGELANMVAGNAKSKFDGLNVSISLPSVILGKEHVVSQSRVSPRLIIPCESALGSFAVEVAMKVRKSSLAGSPSSAAPAKASVSASASGAVAKAAAAR